MRIMKTVVLYRPNSEHGRLVEEFVHEYRARQISAPLEMLNIDERDGAAMARLYDVVRYPAIMVLRDDGSQVAAWQGDSLPLLDEVAGYARGGA